MLSGKRAFPSDDLAETLAAVIKSEPDWAALPNTTPPIITRLLRRCLEKDPRRRVPDIAIARFEIEDALAGPAARETGLAGDARHPMRRVSLLLAVALLAAAAASFLTWTLIDRTPFLSEGYALLGD